MISGMNWTRRDLFKTALSFAGVSYLSGYRAMAAPFEKMVKITAIKTMQIDSVNDGCLIRIDTDAGLTGYGEAGISSKLARDRIELMSKGLIGEDPLAIEKHFYTMSATQYSFIAHIPTVSGIDIALWDLAGKIIGQPIYRLLGGPIRQQIPVYGHGLQMNLLDAGEVRAWAQKVREEPEGFTAFKFGFPRGIGGRQAEPFSPTLDGADFRKVAKGYANIRAALGDDIDVAMHCTGQFDTRTSIGLCRAIEPIDPMWIEDPLTVNYSEAWLELKRSTRVPILAGEKVEMVRGFRPFLDNQVLDMLHPDVAYSGGITGCKKIADYAALTRTPVGLHSGPCSLIRLYASTHLAASIQNFFKLENALGAFRGNKEKMANGKQPAVRKSLLALPEGPGLGLELNEDYLHQHLAKGETYWS